MVFVFLGGDVERHPGPELPAELAERAASFLGVPVAALRREEEERRKEQDRLDREIQKAADNLQSARRAADDERGHRENGPRTEAAEQESRKALCAAGRAAVTHAKMAKVLTRTGRRVVRDMLAFELTWGERRHREVSKRSEKSEEGRDGRGRKAAEPSWTGEHWKKFWGKVQNKIRTRPGGEQQKGEQDKREPIRRPERQWTEQLANRLPAPSWKFCRWAKSRQWERQQPQSRERGRNGGEPMQGTSPMRKLLSKLHKARRESAVHWPPGDGIPDGPRLVAKKGRCPTERNRAKA